MQKANRRARHYVGRNSEINISKSRSYGIATDDKGIGSTNMSGSLKVGEKKRRENYVNEVNEAHAIRQSLRDKKKERGRKRAQNKINAVHERYKRGLITKEERDKAIFAIRLKNKQAEAKSNRS